MQNKVGVNAPVQLIESSGAKPGDDLIVTKWIGLEGSRIIASENESFLLSKLPKTIVDAVLGFSKYIDTAKEQNIAGDFDISSMFAVAEGGIFGALWELGRVSKVGIDVDLRAIPILQETIEVCEIYNINPYMLMSKGALLISTVNGEVLVDAFLSNGIEASIIGKITNNMDRVVRNRDEIRFLEPSKSDEICKVKK